jgi:hypothetical protein
MGETTATTKPSSNNSSASGPKHCATIGTCVACES